MIELEFRAQALEYNFITLKSRCDSRGVELMAVTKAIGSYPPVVEVFSRGGLKLIGDSNPSCLEPLGGTGLRRTLLKTPPSVFQPGRRTWEEAYVSSPWDSPGSGEVVVVLEAGDGKDGVPPEDAPRVLRALETQGCRVVGLGVNFSCLRGLLPTEDLWADLADTVASLRREFPGLKTVSAGGTVVAEWLDLPVVLPITQLRCGEGILLGRDSSRSGVIRGLRTDTAEIRGEILEVRDKVFSPHIPLQGQDAFGRIPDEKVGKAGRRAVLDLGALAAPAGDLEPLNEGVTILGQTYDFLVVELEGPAVSFRPGQSLRFRPGYGALSQGSLSPFVKKSLCQGDL